MRSTNNEEAGRFMLKKRENYFVSTIKGGGCCGRRASQGEERKVDFVFFLLMVMDGKIGCSWC